MVRSGDLHTGLCVLEDRLVRPREQRQALIRLAHCRPSLSLALVRTYCAVISRNDGYLLEQELDLRGPIIGSHIIVRLVPH